MIKLFLAVHDNEEISEMTFTSHNMLCEFLEEIRMFDKIWIFAGDNVNSEIIITENVITILYNITAEIIKDEIYYLQGYDTYEDAYAVALNMRENNPKCYNND